MATAEKKVVLQHRTVLDRVEFIDVRVSMEEANALLAVFGHVGGSNTYSRRALIDSVGQALRQAGAPSENKQDIKNGSGGPAVGIYFTRPDGKVFDY
jgi:hypothetical protein